MTLPMQALPALLPAFLGGFLLGALFFTGLWITVRRLPRASNPVLLILASAVLRLGLALPVLGLLAAGAWPRLLAALLGLLTARTLLILRWRPGRDPEPCS
jgi:F1F0 ATPase subunit 2